MLILIAHGCSCIPNKYSDCVKLRVSYRVTIAGLKLEVVCFVEHRVLLHEQLLIELLYYLEEKRSSIQTLSI